MQPETSPNAETQTTGPALLGCSSNSKDATITSKLLIVGAGAVGISAAYFAKVKHPNLQVTLVEIGEIDNNDREWSSNFSGRQNRLLFTQKYLTEFVIKSNQLWESLQYGQPKKFFHREGSLWMGDVNVTTSEGNIIEAAQVLQSLDIPYTYLNRLDGGQPKFLDFFKLDSEEAKTWSAIYQRDGGSIDMETSYKFFVEKVRNSGVRIWEKTEATKFEEIAGGAYHVTFNKSGVLVEEDFQHVFISVGINTATYVDKTFNTHLEGASKIYDYAATYFEIKPEFEQIATELPTFIHYINREFNCGYGFPYHSWDVVNGKKCVKLCTLLDKGTLEEKKRAAEEYASTYIAAVIPVAVGEPKKCSVVSFDGRETLLDYLNRDTTKKVVVTGGGWVGKFYPLVGKTAIEMLFGEKLEPVVKNFVDRTRFPVRESIQHRIDSCKPPESGSNFDTIIVGAGCSGLYSAYRMIGLNQKVGIFDMSNQISGRLSSTRFKNTSAPMELGGMRYIEKNHKLVANVIHTMNIPNVEFLMSGSVIQNYSLKAYLRNDRYLQNEWENLQKGGHKLTTSYRIDIPDLLGLNAFQMISLSIYKILLWNSQHGPNHHQINEECVRIHGKPLHELIRKVDQFNYEINLELEAWNAIKGLLMYQTTSTHSIVALYRMGFQNIIEDQFSHEAYSFISEQNGYLSNTANLSYLEQVMTYVIDFGNVEYKTLSGGFDMINFNMANALLPLGGTPHAEIYLRHELLDIETIPGDTVTYKLHFRNHSGPLKTHIHYIANKVILAMPKRSVERFAAAPNFSKLASHVTNYNARPPGSVKYLNAKHIHTLSELLQTTESMPAMKIIMNFTNNWWDPTRNVEGLRTAEEMRGVSVTDLPLRQTLYFGQNSQNLLLASYNDMVTTQYWSPLQENFEKHNWEEVSKKHCKSTAKHSHTVLVKTENNNHCTRELVGEVIRQLQAVHGIGHDKLNTTHVKEAMYENWTKDPFGGGYHNWKSGYDIEEVMKAVRRPWKQHNIFIVGEAFSNLTGWVEGAFQTAEHVVQEEYKVSPFVPGYYIGY